MKNTFIIHCDLLARTAFIVCEDDIEKHIDAVNKKLAEYKNIKFVCIKDLKRRTYECYNVFNSKIELKTFMPIKSCSKSILNIFNVMERSL